MISAAVSVVFYALVAAASPLVLAATLVVIRSERQRTNSIAFLTGFVIGTALAAVLGLLLGQAAVARLDAHETLEALLALLLGIALVAAGVRERRNPRPPGTGSGRERVMLARLSHVRPGAAVSIGGLLGFGGPKRLVLAFLAMAAVSAADLGIVEDLTLVVGYVAVATILVSVPVGVVVVGGSRATALIGRSESWLRTNSSLLRVWLAIVLGVGLVIDGVLRLF